MSERNRELETGDLPENERTDDGRPAASDLVKAYQRELGDEPTDTVREYLRSIGQHPLPKRVTGAGSWDDRSNGGCSSSRSGPRFKKVTTGHPPRRRSPPRSSEWWRPRGSCWRPSP